ncbi:MAG: pseudouridine synthase [Pseudomonadota bacterium]
MAERIQVILARAGVASRRRSEDLVRQGRVTVNGALVTQPGFMATVGKDDIRVDGRPVSAREPKLSVMLNKPRQVVTTAFDPQGRVTVLDIVKGVNQRLFPVGRLDYETEGLLLLTNDGLFANRLQHPRYGVEKIYMAKVRGEPCPDAMDRLKNGIFIDGRMTAPARVKKIKETRLHTWIEITIHEGRNRQVRRMCEAIGHPVLRLIRIGYGPLRLGNLRPGRFKLLKKNEIDLLERLCYE